MKTLFRLIVVLVVLAAGLYFGRNFIAQQSVQAGVKEMTGFPLNIGSLDLALGQSRIAVRDLSLLNPPEFKEPVFVEMPELTVDYDAGSMLSGTPHLTSLVVDLKRIVIVRTKTGDSNAMKLKGALGGGGGKSHYKVDTFRLKIGTVELYDYKMGNPMKKRIPLNLDETYRNFTDATDINRLVLLTVLKKAGLPNIGIDMSQLSGSLGNISNAAGEAVKSLTDTLGKSGADAAETLQKTGKGLFDSFKKMVPGTPAK
ncbi:MAG: hypothetical protein NTY01_15865 [Verrucomicrobia bacterium]|nr:hypothetical protein [Verrucomicrobiota bacterium]